MKIFTFLIFLLTTVTFGQKINLEDKLKDVELKQIKIDGTLSTYDILGQTKDKVTIIEFWETWCGPCIENMGHLMALKREFPDRLNVVCVSNDDIDKTIDFIEENDYPFDFIHDPSELMSEKFPHTGIPHTILVDSKGIVQSETYPSFVTKNTIAQLENGEVLTVPKKLNFDPEELQKTRDRFSLMQFDLGRYELGSYNFIQESREEEIPVKILKGYSTNDQIDTVETITNCVIAGRNALEIYQYAYEDIPLTRFVYGEELNYINSITPNFLYSLRFSSSSLLGDHKNLLINQLNSLWGLQTKKIQKETTYYELVKITAKKGVIAPIINSTSTIKPMGKMEQSFKFLNLSNMYSAQQIAALFEDQIIHLQSNKYWDQEQKKNYYPVITNLTGTYVLEFSIENESSSVEEWVRLFEEKGLQLVKREGMVTYVSIDKALP